jgi:hypothetical protein
VDGLDACEASDASDEARGGSQARPGANARRQGDRYRLAYRLGSALAAFASCRTVKSGLAASTALARAIGKCSILLIP